MHLPGAATQAKHCQNFISYTGDERSRAQHSKVKINSHFLCLDCKPPDITSRMKNAAIYKADFLYLSKEYPANTHKANNGPFTIKIKQHSTKTRY